MIEVRVITNNNVSFQLPRKFRSVDAFHDFWNCRMAGSLLEVYPIVEGEAIKSDTAIEYVVKRNIAHLALRVITERSEE